MNENYASASIQIITRGLDIDGQPLRVPREISLKELAAALAEAVAAPPPIEAPIPPRDPPDITPETGENVPSDTGTLVDEDENGGKDKDKEDD